MNWLLLCVAAVIAVCVWTGYRKGFLHIVFSLVSIALLVAFVTITTPYFRNFLEEHTSLEYRMEKKCLEALRTHASKDLEDEMQENAPDSREKLQDAGIRFPDRVWDHLLETGIDAADQALEESGLYQRLAAGMSRYIVNGIASCAAWITGAILLAVLARLLHIVSRLPVIREVNHILGVASGLLLGLAVTWIFFYIITICCASPFGMMMTDYIHRSAILTWLYNHNVILYMLTIFF